MSGSKQAHPALGRLALAITPEADPGETWDRGAVGEERLARSLDALPLDRALSLHDRRMPGSRANIDHIVVTANGVWVIDAKRYKGLVEKRDVGRWLRADDHLYVAGRDRSSLLDGVANQVDHVWDALEELPTPTPMVRGVLCFMDAEWRVFARPFELHSILVAWPRVLRRRLLDDGAIDAAQRAVIQRHLAISFPPALRAS